VWDIFLQRGDICDTLGGSDAGIVFFTGQYFSQEETFVTPLVAVASGCHYASEVAATWKLAT